jgi:hypothetical protein
VALSYYAARSARDPGWREREAARVREAERRRREADPEGFRAARREANRRCRARQAARGLTFQQLLDRSRAAAGATPQGIGDEAVLAYVLRDELRRGTIDYHSSSRRYVLNGKLDAETLAAFRDLPL